MTSKTRWATVAGLAIALGACSSSSPTATVPSVTTQASRSTATTTASSEQTPLAQGEAYSKCMRSHGVTSWPDPELTPSGGYGYRTGGVDPKAPSFKTAEDACKSLVPQWFSGGAQLTAEQQQAWLTWAKCIRTHGDPGFADPTFPGGGAVAISTEGRSPSPQLQAAMDACKAQMPKTGGLGG